MEIATVSAQPMTDVAREQHDWHAEPAERAVALTGTSAESGLSSDEVARRLARFGPNALPEKGPTSIVIVFLRQFKSPLVYLLFVAAALGFVLGHRTDAAVILVIVTLNALLGALQEGRAERSMEALRSLSASHARVLREGHEEIVLAREVVLGDILLLAAGDAIAADARLLEAASLEVAEAALTGESLPVSKTTDAQPSDAPLADRRSMVHAGTHVTAGRGRSVVVATATGTEVGKIAALTVSAVEPRTPLVKRIAEFGRWIIYAAVGMSLLVVAIGLLRGLPTTEMLMVAVSQLVAMVPEGLPVAVTVALALGARRIARKGALVRRLVAVETLGSTTVICSDKTGTLTSNQMTVTALYFPGRRAIEVTGAGYAPEGHLEEAGRPVGEDPDVTTLAEALVLCNDAQLVPPSAGEPQWRAIGDPTEAALLTLAAKTGASAEATRKRWKRRREIPFDAATKMMATEHEDGHSVRVIVKGAPDVLIELCGHIQEGGRTVPLDAAGKGELKAAWERMAGEALRVLGVAVVTGDVDLSGGLAALAGKLTLLGLVGQIDPPRSEARDAVKRCKNAGIRVIMVTGDHGSTALAVARQLGIAEADDRVIDGRRLAQLSDAELAEALAHTAVFARVHPAQKLRIVKALQGRGEVVAMTGDGVNDAPALATADVGVAMGITGTEVAKMAAKVVITDDDFATIVRAVEEGRVVHANLKKAILYLVSTAAAGVLILVTALLLGFPAPLAAVQILWINLVTDGVVALPLATGPAEEDAMARPPVPPKEPLLTRPLLRRMALMVPAMTVSTLGYFVFRLESGVPFAEARADAFTVLAFCQWFNALNCHANERSVFRLGLSRERWLLLGVAAGLLLHAGVLYTGFGNRLFYAAPLGVLDLVAITVVASLVLWVEELRKVLARHRTRRRDVEHRRARDIEREQLRTV